MRKPSKLQGIIAHAAEGDTPEAQTAQRMLVTRGNPARDVSPIGEEMDVTSIVQRAEQALELALSVPDIKRVRDEAATLSDYLHRRGFGEGAAAKASRIIRLAEWRIGDALTEMQKPKSGIQDRSLSEGGLKGRGGSLPHPDSVRSLGIDENAAYKWQHLARSVSYERLAEELEHRVEIGEPLTFAAIQRKFAPAEPKGEQADWEQQNDDFTEALQWAANAGDTLYRSLGRGRPLASDRAGTKEWMKECNRLETAIKQQVAFLRKMQVYCI